MTEADDDRFSAFAFYWEVTNYERRRRVGFHDHTSWNTILRVGKMTPKDFPVEDDDDSFNLEGNT
jgi:hypothetical protein